MIWVLVGILAMYVLDQRGEIQELRARLEGIRAITASGGNAMHTHSHAVRIDVPKHGWES